MKKLLTLLLLLTVAAATARAQRSTATVSGYITDETSGETLLGAGVLLDNGSRTPTGAVTNVYGFYTLTLPKGKTRLQYSYVGYESRVVELDLQRDTAINIVLNTASLAESVVVAQRDAGIQSTYLGAIEVPIAQIQNTPVLFGEADVLKAIQLMPGVQGGNEGFTGLYVRGGGPDENLILLDGTPIYNVDHMLGILSVFQTEAVKKVTLYKGSFPARYGGRVSSIVDIRTNDGNMKETHGSIGLGALTEKLHLEGPIVKDKLSYSLSGRGLHTLLYDPIIRMAMGKGRYGNYFFYDLSGKLTWRLSDKDRFFLGGYSGKDNMGIRFEEDGTDYYVYNEDVPGAQTQYFMRTDMGIGWGNNVASLRWNHIFSSRLFSNTTIAFNQYQMLMHMGLKEEVEGETAQFDVNYNSGIRDWSAKLDFDYVPTPAHLVKFGAEYTYHTFVPETLTAVMSDTINEATNGEGLNYRSPYESYVGHDIALYAEDDFSIGNHLTINPGLYASLFLTDGKPYFNLQPRLSAKLSLDNGISFKTGYARMAQYVHLLSSFSISLPLDLWVPITKNIKPVTSDQVSAGIYYDGLPGWEFSIEGYWKHIDNLLEYKDGTIVLGNSMGWENKVEMGQGTAKGLEFFVQKTQGKLTGWVAYTLAKSDRVFPDGSINLGRPFPYKYDRRHNFNININYKLGKVVELNAAWSFASGSATTIPLQRTVVLAPDTIYNPEFNGYSGGARAADFVEERNNYRLPPSHRLNVGANFKAGDHWIFNLSVYNVYNNMNPNMVFVDYTYQQNADGTYYTKPVMRKITILPIMPSTSITYQF
ncbi:MAG: TonB-dependent receptor [Bacteroidales bacterium]|nr:TonB-dependent receptor [Bacteroidales bacterium]